MSQREMRLIWLFVILNVCYNNVKSLHHNHKRKLVNLEERNIKENNSTQKRGKSDPTRSSKHNKILKKLNKLKLKSVLTKSKDSLESGRKSTIDIHENLGRSPVIYNSPDGKDYFVFVNTKTTQQTVNQASPQTTSVNQAGNVVPSKTFMVTVYGDQINGAKERIREALTKPLVPKSCDCPHCNCHKSPDNNDCSCEQQCNCNNQETSDDNSPHKPMVLFFPTCNCPCCPCSCSQHGYDNYQCGCQKTPSVPCPCDNTNNYQSSTTMSSYESSPSNGNNCPCGNQPGCACNGNPMVNNFVRSDSSVPPSTMHQAVGPYDVQTTCDCHCCPCECPVSFSSGVVHCECTPEQKEACSCKRTNL